MHFRNGHIKPLVMNKTNAMLAAAACGSEDFSTWPGKQVRLYADLVNFRGKVSEAVRMKRTPPPIAEELNDKVNF
jgi:hypothetical protein